EFATGYTSSNGQYQNYGSTLRETLIKSEFSRAQSFPPEIIATLPARAGSVFLHSSLMAEQCLAPQHNQNTGHQREHVQNQVHAAKMQIQNADQALRDQPAAEQYHTQMFDHNRLQ